ncbi:MAG TPA: methyltransferase domain-containing protein [Polyangiaceae bacterium]
MDDNEAPVKPATAARAGVVIPINRGASARALRVTGDDARAARGRRIGARLRAGGPLTDSQFDELYPFAVRVMSTTFWTPVKVAQRAAKLLVRKPGCRVLDIGSGAGKFCLVGAMSTEGRFFGVEQRENLVDCARAMATLLGSSSATFTHGLFDSMNPEDYDAFYLFNPFEENKFAPDSQFDWTVTLGKERFKEDVRRAQQFLRGARPGTRVVTYNGMGAKLPWCYDLVEREQMGCAIEVWVKDAQAKRAHRGTL